MRKTKVKKIKGKPENNNTKQNEIMFKKLKNIRGITLIALIVTIIVLLILAGVSIATLTGDNGILNRANEAREETQQATAEEKVGLEVQGSYDETGKINMDMLNDNLKNISGLKYNGQLLADNRVRIESLPATVEVDGYEVLIGSNGIASIVIRIEGAQTETTKPYLPSRSFTQVEGTNLENGLVITDGTNYWTWIEVPTNIYQESTSESDYEAIENDMEIYTNTLLSRNEREDIWYDGHGNTVDKSKSLNDTSGCGLTYEEYNTLKNYMLSSVYQNGGFWIGQYEAGTSSYPATSANDTRNVIIQEGVYPYNYITCSNAQIQSSKIDAGNYTSSLMFGIQWDLVLKHLQVNGTEITELISDSSNWGNYFDIDFNISKGGYSINSHIPNSFTLLSEENSTYLKPKNTGVLLTTGATDRNMKMNIYDLAGNIFEWTLERGDGSQENFCVCRGGAYGGYGSANPASQRLNYDSSYNYRYGGFRPALY